MNGISRFYDAIVIGVGGMGSAAIYNLAKRGKRVLGLEQYDIPHDMGSSHGQTRIIRLAYYEHSSYVMLLQRAYELWESLERLAGEKLLHITGSIDAGPADSWVFKGSLRSCIEHDLPHEVHTGKELEQHFPGYRLPFDHMALYQPRGGFLVPERCTVAYVQAAHALGAEIHAREPVVAWEAIGDGVRVTTTREVYEADRLVITAGAWNNQILPILQGLATPERQVLAWFHPRKSENFLPQNFPVFNLLVDEGRYYGFPVHGVPGFKVGKYHHFEEHGDADDLDRRAFSTDELMLREFTDRYFPDASGPTMSLKSCLFTNSPDGHFIIDLYPQHPQVSFAAGFTGHGYKFASVVGEILSDLAIQGHSRHDIDLFRHDRFGRDGRPKPYIDRSRDHLRQQHVSEVFHPIDPELRFRRRHQTRSLSAYRLERSQTGSNGDRRTGAEMGRGPSMGSIRQPRQNHFLDDEAAGRRRVHPLFDSEDTRPFW